MENRIANIIIQTPGGTAAKGSSTYKVSLPSSWVKELGITAEDRQIELSFDGTSITISKRLNLQQFIETRKAKGHQLILLSYFDNQTMCSQIAADDTGHSLCVENYTSDVLRTAFGNNRAPTWDDFQAFLEERCIPRNRAGLREYLEAIGLEEYDPLEIIKKTSGRMAEDHQWLKVKVIK